MNARKIVDGVNWMGAVDWDRRLFDSIIPLPEGTSYNAYLVNGSEKVALLDTVDPTTKGFLMEQLKNVPRIDYLVAHHAEQDHSGVIPAVLAKYPDAKLVCSKLAKDMLVDHLDVPPERIIVVKDGELLDLGGKTLQFVYTPWVHWPETMVTYLQQDRILFTCDFFGSHYATSELYADEARVYEPAKRYFAEIMMPFRKAIQKNIEKVEALKVDMIAPSHGPIYRNPRFIIDAYKDWVSDTPKNVVLVPFVSMHDSTRLLVERLVSDLADRGVRVHQFDLARADIGKIAAELVDAATVVVGTPTFQTGIHPLALYATYLVSLLKGRVRFASVVGSYGWMSKAVDQVAGMIAPMKLEIIEPVICKGLPREKDYKAIDVLADRIAEKHKALGLK
jgi:flavorubredoxin